MLTRITHLGRSLPHSETLALRWIFFCQRLVMKVVKMCDGEAAECCEKRAPATALRLSIMEYPFVYGTVTCTACELWSNVFCLDWTQFLPDKVLIRSEVKSKAHSGEALWCSNSYDKICPLLIIFPWGLFSILVFTVLWLNPQFSLSMQSNL